ncbi:hypothetical protein JXA48_03865 [Candidatus Woesearchaeota archaeon]|nr:hypothetical protein [Candidatus Woesearchaeota archaeon]
MVIRKITSIRTSTATITISIINNHRRIISTVRMSTNGITIIGNTKSSLHFGSSVTTSRTRCTTNWFNKNFT